ncbi:MAG TPA: polyprenyl synthetase family protein [Actinomycetota bacterium]|nr:polyprenyl synthetase family protein [Actinomycetota bacterium]
MTRASGAPTAGRRAGLPDAATPAWLRADMDRIEALLLDRAGSSAHPLVSEASTHLIKAGGKRLRPALVLMTARAGDARGDVADLSAAAIELVHLATLYHDDVIDETDTRRGVPTVHAKWGTEVAVLAGDYLFARGCALGAEAGGEVPGILARAIGEVCEGQILETASLGDAHRSIDDYLGIIRRKTAALFRAACELGAAASGVSGEDRAALVSYGEHLGLAFQMVDDLLDLVGDPDVTGKVPGTDLREGVFTLPVLIACERDASFAQRLAAGHLELEPALAALRTTGALDAALDLATSHASAAHTALETLPRAEWRDALDGMVDGVLLQVTG